MSDELLIRTLVREVLVEALRDEGAAATTPLAPPSTAPAFYAAGPPPRPSADPATAALSAKVAAWVGRPQATLPGPPAVWRPSRDRAGYLASTPARLGVGRAGTRCRTATVLEFRADHAAARDAVRSELEPELVTRLGLVALSSAAKDKSEFLRRPDQGRKLDEESAAKVLQQCTKKPQVQIVCGDGLSATALRVNLPRMLPVLLQRLEEAHLRVGRPVYIRNARVAVGDQVGQAIDAELLIMLVGERPGLKSAESVGAYLTYLGGRKFVESQRSVISNIHDRGIPPEEGARNIVTLALEALRVRATGLDLGVR